MKSTANELSNGLKLAWYHHFTHIACAKKLRGLGQKLDALRVQNEQSLSKSHGLDENSSVRKGFQIFKHISTQDFLCIQYAPFKATYWNLNPCWLHLLIYMHSMIYFGLNDPEIGKHYNWTRKRLQLRMVSSFDPHNLCAKVERITAKTGCTSCTN